MKFFKIFLIFIIFIILFMMFMAFKEEIKYRPFGYKIKEKISEGEFQDFVDFYIYQYDEKDDDKFIKHKRYSKVEDNIDTIESWFRRVAGDWPAVEKYYKESDFDYSFITPDDYYYLNTDFSEEGSFVLYYYDIDSHVLYAIKSVN